MNNLTRRSFLGVLGAVGLAAAAAGAVGCSSGSNTSDSNNVVGDLDLSDWDAVLEAAKGTTVTYIGYGQATAYNNYFNNIFAPTMKEKYDIDFAYTQVDATADIITLWMNEKQANLEVGEGTTDTGWVSGDYVVDLVDNNLLWGDYLQYLPNMKYYDQGAEGIATIAGMDINGTMSLFASSYFSLIYDAAHVDEADVPHNTDELMEYVKANPGRVTYPAIPDYHGSYFARWIAMDVCGKDVFNNMSEDITYDEMKEAIEPALEYMRELNPYLWNEGKTYPTSFSDWVTMFADGSTDFLYDEAWVKPSIDAGSFPETTHSTCLDIISTEPHHLTIPFDCLNLPAALVMCNEFLDPEGMCERGATGYPPAVDCMIQSELSDEQLQAIDDCDEKFGENAPSLDELGANATANWPVWCKSIFEDIWTAEVASKTND